MTTGSRRKDMRKNTGASANAETGSRASAEPCSTVSALTGFDPARVTVKQIIARIIAPSSWNCVDAWEDVPDGVRQRAVNSLRQADIILKLVGAADRVEMLLKIRGYIDGALDCPMSINGLRSVIRGWADEIDAAIATEAQRAATGNTGAVEDEGAGRRHRQTQSGGTQ